MLGSARRVVKKCYKIGGRAVSEAVLTVTSVPGGDTVSLRRMGFGTSMVLDPRGSTLLDFLGDDLEERAQTLDRFLNRCTDEELSELLDAFQEAAVRRATRQEAARGKESPYASGR